MNESGAIGFLDLQEQHEQLHDEIFARFEEVYAQTAFSDGPFAREFEEAFASYCGTSHSVTCNSGTSALHLALAVLDVGPGDEVILPANTFISTAWAVSYVGARPVFVDCTSGTWEIDPAEIERALSSKTKAIIGVHLYGQPFDVDAVRDIAEHHGIPLVEDAAQAAGARYRGTRVGGFGEMACFSFYPGKNLGACGEGGAVTTNRRDYRDRLTRLRNHASGRKHFHDELGFNMRMGGLEAASLSVKLKYLDTWNVRRRQIARRYRSEIRNDRMRVQEETRGGESVYHLFVVTVDDRARFVEDLNEHGLFPGMHYPVPCHLQQAYSHLGHRRGDLPNTEHLAERCVSLPMYAELKDSTVDTIVGVLNSYRGA